MHKLFIIRHAIAEDREDFQKTLLPDEVRPLTYEGEKKMKKIAARLYELFPDIEHFVQSPLLRSQQTVDVLKHFYKKATVSTSENLRPSASFYDLCADLNKLGHENLAIVGHEDHLSYLTSFFMTGKIIPSRQHPLMKYKKGGGALLQFEKEFSAGGAQLHWMYTPKFLL